MADVQTTIRVDGATREHLQKVAKKRGTTFSGLLIEGARMLADFDEGFLDEMQKASDRLRLNRSTVIQQLMINYLAFDMAMMEVLGTSKTFERAFRFGPDGLITGDELSKQIQKETEKDLRELFHDIRMGIKKYPFRKSLINSE